ncbi:hypothetical protein UCRPA7_3610 [Phaeoacremonium minimum UCRPA7]|uniref:Uncharacterized protein n=1 Tax=Phaeoacremonium minimum (strain UCR-PA7) TaxID=1286976 RepID=R8BNT0_PHAM7|nr:hypothetical protein UCRPA7_3610 [Phaeoacremonium minimum UCRPA7]EOO00935.1 hypothetical protein UCRPA7_3610 [Phaeoacremonium minimum UCRPA7]
MRTRRKNKETRFTYGADVYGLSSDEESDDPAARRASRQDKDDVNFDEVNASASGTKDANGNDNLVEAETEIDDDFDDEVSEAEISDDDDNEAIAVDSEIGRGRAAPKRIRPKKQKPKPSGHVHEVPAYPTDIRQTRIYVGPLKRWTRHHQLADLYYSTGQKHLSIALQLLASIPNEAF